MKTDNIWRIWDREHKYGQVLYRRAVGELPEMESSKSVAKTMKVFIKPGDSIVDVGCGAGHYLRSLLAAVDVPFTYTGVDATKAYVELARKAWAVEDRASFMEGDVFCLPFEDMQYDVVICCNMLLHLPAIKTPLMELLRVARRDVMIRSLFGDRSFRVQEVYSPKTHPGFPPFAPGTDEFDENGEPRAYYFLNTYSSAYVASLLDENPRVKSFTFTDDTNFDPQALERDAESKDGAVNATRSIDGFQFNGPLRLDWKLLHIELDV